MTEEEWLASENAKEMLDCECMGAANSRKQRLFAVACCRRIWRLLTDPRSKEAVERAEEYAEGRLTIEKLLPITDQAWVAHLQQHNAAYHASQAAVWVADETPGFAARETADAAIAATVCDPDDPEEDHLFQAIILRDIFGNPFHPVSVDPSWLNSTVLAIAQRMYDSRDFSAMPVLADALQVAGCDNAAILDHCRGPGPHTRGCFVVDLLLGKE